MTQKSHKIRCYAVLHTGRDTGYFSAHCNATLHAFLDSRGGRGVVRALAFLLLPDLQVCNAEYLGIPCMYGVYEMLINPNPTNLPIEAEQY
jgi:hypothetical protein